MNINLGHIWVRQIPTYLANNKYKSLLCLVICSKCGVPEIHEDAKKHCQEKYVYEYEELLNGDFYKVELRR